MRPSTTRFRADAFWSSAGTLIPIVAGAAATPFILQSLGVDRFAVYALSLAIISFAPNFDFGISRTVFRRVAATVATDASRVSAMSKDAIAWARKAGVAATLILSPVVLSIVAHESTSAGRSVEVIWPIVVALLAIPAAIVGNTQRAILEGARRFDASAGIRIGLGLITAVLPAMLCLVTSHVLVLVSSLLLLRVLATWYQQGILRAQGLLLSAHHTRSPEATVCHHSDTPFHRESSWYAVAAPVSLLMSGFDRFLILALTTLTLADLTAFLAPQEIALRAIIFPAAVIPAVVVRIAPHQVASDETRNLLFLAFISIVGLTFVGCFASSFLAQSIADLAFRSLPSDQVVPIIRILCVGIFSNAVAQFPAATLNGRGMSNVPAILQLCELPLFLLALPFLVVNFGPEGAAIAWTARIVIDTILLLISADSKTPTFTMKHWHILHGVGLVALLTPIVA